MDQSYPQPTSRLISRSFNHERLARINRDPFEVPDAPRSRLSESPRRIFNYVKDKVNLAVSGIQKLWHNTSSPQSPARPSPVTKVVPQIPQEKLASISSMIQQTVSKPEYKINYSAGSHREANLKKTSILDVVNYYKDVSGEKIREKMKESNSFAIPPLAESLNSSVQFSSPRKTREEAVNPAKRQMGQSNSLKRSDSGLSNGKRGFPSILSKKEKSIKEKKTVSFLPELRRSNSGMIQYVSSDEDEDIDKPQKKVFNAEQGPVIKDPPLRISIVKKIKVNPFQKSNVEKTSISQFLKQQKDMKGKGFDKFVAGKFNHDNSFDNNILNDSKLETDSDESSQLHNSDFDDYKRFGRDDNLSEGSQRDIIPSPAKMRSPSLEHVEEQDLEREESSFGDLEEEEKQSPVQVQEKVTAPVEPEPVKQPEPVIKPEPVVKSSLFTGLFSQTKPVIAEEKKVAPVIVEEKAVAAPLFMNKPEQTVETSKPSLFSSLNTLPPKEAAAPIFSLTTTNEPSSPSKANPMALFQQSLVEDTIVTKKDEIAPILPVSNPSVTTSDSAAPPVIKTTSVLSNEEAMKNPIFANLLKKNDSVLSNNPFLSKNDSVMTNNPFLNNFSTSQNSVSLGGLVAGRNDSIIPQKPEETQAPVLPEPALISKPSGILGMLASAPSQTSSIFTNTLKPINTSWMSQEKDEGQKNNLFGNLFSNTNNSNSGLGQSTQNSGLFAGLNNNNNTTAQSSNNGLFGGLSNLNNNNNSSNTMGESSQNGLFGNLSSFGNNSSNGNSTGFGMAFENGNNSMMGDSGNNNTSNSLFGNSMGNSTGLNNNSGLGGMFGGGNNLFQSNNNNNTSSLFGSSMNNNNNDSNPFLSGGMNTASQSGNPFLSQGSGTSDLFRQDSSLSSGYLNRSTSSYSIGGSAKKGRNQKERAF